MANFFIVIYTVQTSSFLVCAVLIKTYFSFVDNMKNVQVTDSKNFDIFEETLLEKNCMDTIHGFGQLKYEEIAVSKSFINNYWYSAKDNFFNNIVLHKI